MPVSLRYATILQRDSFTKLTYNQKIMKALFTKLRSWNLEFKRLFGLSLVYSAGLVIYLAVFSIYFRNPYAFFMGLGVVCAASLLHHFLAIRKRGSK
jgi:hypothetical protein